MCPTILWIGPVPIRGYGLMLAIGFLLAVSLAQKNSKKFGIEPKIVADIFPWLIVSAALGSRLFHVVVERPMFFLEHPLDILKFWEGGVTYYGGLFGAIIALYFFCKKHKMSLLNLFDFLITYVALGQVFGRLGCFLAGCCHGIPTDLPWGIAITNPESVTRPLGMALHPTQLYQSFWNLLTFLILYFAAKHKKFTGENILIYGIVYSIGRSIIEIYRGDSVRGFIIDGYITTSQGISIVLITICSILLVRKYYLLGKD